MHAERERVQDNIQDIMPSSLSSTLSSSSITIHEESTPYIETGPNITSEEEETDPERIYYQYGNLHHLFGSPKGHFPYTCIIGPDWKVLLISYILIIGISLYFTISIAPKIHLWMIITTPFQTLITLLFLSLTACSDAGVVYSNDVDCSQGGVVTCAQCQIPRPNTAMHCFDCQVCVDELDHHCPWIGKCIGKKTIQYFYAFLGNLMGLIILVAGGAIYKFTRDH